MEESDDIVFAGGDALVYLAKPMHKKRFDWGIHFVRNILWPILQPLPTVRTCTHFGWPPSILLAAYVFNGWPISQPKSK